MITKTCKRCGVTIHLEADPCCPQEWAEKLAKPVVLCNRCADFGWARLLLIEAIFKNANRLEVLRSKDNRTNEESKLIDMHIDNIKTMVRAFATKVCEFYRSNFVWDSEFPMNIIHNTDKAGTQLSMYEIGIRQAVQKDDPF